MQTTTGWILESVLTFSSFSWQFYVFFLDVHLLVFLSLSHFQTSAPSFCLFFRSGCSAELHLCRRLLTSSRNFLFPLTQPHTVTFTLADAHTISCCRRCCEWHKLIKWVWHVTQDHIDSVCMAACFFVCSLSKNKFYVRSTTTLWRPLRKHLMW